MSSLATYTPPTRRVVPKDIVESGPVIAMMRHRVWEVPEEQINGVFKDYILSPEPFAL